MGRHKTIDRNQVLDAAEAVVAARGAGALTIGMVAEAAGITKGGVQSCFGTKDALVSAMLDRWLADDRGRFERLAGKTPAPLERVRAHVAVTRGYDASAQARVSSLLAALLQASHTAQNRVWYQERLEGFTADDAATRRARLAFFAAEGVFHLRFLGLLPIDSQEWNDIFDDIDALLVPHAP